MKILLVKLAFILSLGNPGNNEYSKMHTTESGELNLSKLHQIESLIRKKAGAEFEKSHENSFTLNGYNVYTAVVDRNFGPDIYEESFYDVKNPDNIYKMRLIKNTYGEWELAVLIKENDGVSNYHACFDKFGRMLEDDPWGTHEGYTIEIFDLYRKYRKMYSKKVDLQ